MKFILTQKMVDSSIFSESEDDLMQHVRALEVVCKDKEAYDCMIWLNTNKDTHEIRAGVDRTPGNDIFIFRDGRFAEQTNAFNFVLRDYCKVHHIQSSMVKMKY